MSGLRIGDRVGFARLVLDRTGQAFANMRGTIQRFDRSGNIAFVECGDTFTSEEGRTLRAIPVKNLRMMDNFVQTGRLYLKASNIKEVQS